MKNNKKMVILVIQLVALVLFIISYKNYTDSIVKPISVYQFSRTIPEGTKIQASDLALAEVATNTYKSNMILSTDISSVVGKYTTTKVYKDTLCYTAQFGALDTSNSMFTSLDLTNAILLSLEVDMNAVGGYLAPGDKINLIFTGQGTASIINLSKDNEEGDESGSDSNEESSEDFVFSKTFLQDVTVYDVLGSNGFKYIQKADRYYGQLPSVDVVDPGSADSNSIAYLLLIVSPEEAEEIKTREHAGQITIVKRFDETETHDTLGYIIGNYGKIFSGNANAETSSLQIISTIQDTDRNNDVLTNNPTGSTSNNNNNNNSSNQNNNENNQSGSAELGVSGVE